MHVLGDKFRLRDMKKPALNWLLETCVYEFVRASLIFFTNLSVM